MIVTKESIQSAYVRVREHAGDHEDTCAAVAQELGVPVESVHEAVPAITTPTRAAARPP